MRWFIKVIVVAGLLPLAAGAQTTVVIKCTEHAIYAGADSRVFKTNVNDYTGKSDTVLQSMCKLRQVGNIHFAVLGYFAQTSARIAVAACSNKPSLQQAVNIYIHRFGQIAADSLAVYRQFAGDQFSNFQDGTIISQTIFFGYENSRRYVLKTEFYFKQLSNGGFTVGCDTLSGKLTFAAGHTKQIQALLVNDKTWKSSSAKAIRNLISIESKSDSLYVGGPVDIMKVTDKRTRWISRKKGCPVHE